MYNNNWVVCETNKVNWKGQYTIKICPSEHNNKSAIGLLSPYTIDFWLGGITGGENCASEDPNSSGDNRSCLLGGEACCSSFRMSWS